MSVAGGNYISEIVVPENNTTTTYALRDTTIRMYQATGSAEQNNPNIKDITCEYLTTPQNGDLFFITFAQTNTTTGALTFSINGSLTTYSVEPQESLHLMENIPYIFQYIKENNNSPGRFFFKDQILGKLPANATGDYQLVLNSINLSDHEINIPTTNAINYNITNNALWNDTQLQLQIQTAGTILSNIMMSTTETSITSPAISIASPAISIANSTINVNTSTIILNTVDPIVYVDWQKGTTSTTAGKFDYLIHFMKSGANDPSELVNKWGDIYCGKPTSANAGRMYFRVFQNKATTLNAYLAISIDNSTTPVRRTYTNCKIYGAVWNDYAEYRMGSITAGGYCVTETPSGAMIKSTERLQPGCKITSDTFGFAIGKNKDAKSPIAVSGRVLVYPYRSREEYSLGAALCSAPNGTVDIMTREEIREYPERIIGTVSEIPEYEVWHGGDGEGDQDVEVDGRIWIYVK